MRLLMLAVGLALSGCGAKTPPQARPEQTRAMPVVAGPEATAALMAEHATIVEELRYAVVAGDLEGVRRSALQLEMLPVPDDMRGDWMPHFANMRATALVVEGVTDMGSAGKAVAQLGRTCGGCHEATGAGPDLVIPARTFAWRKMPRHAWAVEWMWAGVVAPSGVAFDAGAAELAGSPLLQEPAEDGRAAWVIQLALASSEALHADESEHRAEALGSVLGACGGCHAAAHNAM